MLGAANVSAQVSLPSPVPTTTRLCWDHDGVNLDGFSIYLDATPKVDAMKPVPVGTTYCIPFPAMTPGSHSITITAYNVKGESAKPAPLTLTLIINVPAIPSNIRITP